MSVLQQLVSTQPKLIEFGGGGALGSAAGHMSCRCGRGNKMQPIMESILRKRSIETVDKHQHFLQHLLKWLKEYTQRRRTEEVRRDIRSLIRSVMTSSPEALKVLPRTTFSFEYLCQSALCWRQLTGLWQHTSARPPISIKSDSECEKQQEADLCWC